MDIYEMIKLSKLREQIPGTPEYDALLGKGPVRPLVERRQRKRFGLAGSPAEAITALHAELRDLQRAYPDSRIAEFATGLQKRKEGESDEDYVDRVDQRLDHLEMLMAFDTEHTMTNNLAR